MNIEEVEIDKRSEDEVLDLILDAVSRNKQVLVFVNSKRSAEKVAEDCAKELLKQYDYPNLKNKILEALNKPTKQCRRLAKIIRRGCAFHHSGLVPKQRNIIEDAYKNDKIKVICATPTLAQGVNLPAFRVIIRDIKRYSDNGMRFLPTFEYHQMSGRAGRGGKEDIGEAVIVSKKNDPDKLFEKYCFASAEEIYSKLAVEPTLRKFLLSLIERDMNSKEEIMDFFSDTFYAHQFKDINKIEELIEKIMSELIEANFIIKTKNKLKLSPVGKRINQLYIDPFSAKYIIESFEELDGFRKSERVISLLYIASRTYEMRPLPRVRNSEWHEIQEFIYKNEEMLFEEMDVYDNDYEEKMKAIKQTQIFFDWINEKKEEEMLEKFNLRPGQLYYKITNLDWIIYVMREISRIVKNDLTKELDELRLRTKYGTKQELVGLLKLKGIGKIRARKLYNNGIKKFSDFKEKSKVARKVLGDKIYEKVSGNKLKEYKYKNKGKTKKRQSKLSNF